MQKSVAFFLLFIPPALSVHSLGLLALIPPRFCRRFETRIAAPTRLAPLQTAQALRHEGNVYRFT